MQPLDGNAMAGVMHDLFARDMTTMGYKCTGCGKTGVMAEMAVYMSGPGTVARCSPNAAACTASIRRDWPSPDVRRTCCSLSTWKVPMTIQTPPDPTADETAMHLPHAVMRFLREADPQHKANAHDLLAAFATDATVVDNEHSYTGHDESIAGVRRSRASTPTR